VHFDTFMDWKNRDPEFAAKVEKVAAKAALRLLGKIEKQATSNFSACAWILERRFPELFSRPEVQLNLQTNIVQNNLTITISPQEAHEIEARAEPVRQSVKEMMAKYRPGLGNGNGQSAAPISPAGSLRSSASRAQASERRLVARNSPARLFRLVATSGCSGPSAFSRIARARS